MTSRWNRTDAPRGDAYDVRWRELEEAGGNPHGEADFVAGLGPSSVLDAGCGTGRVAIELARRGMSVVGVDLDGSMLATARAKAPTLRWYQNDLARLDLDDRFDVVVLAGNVMIFLDPGTEHEVVARCARHLTAGGRLVAGFQLQPGGLDPDGYDVAATRAGLELEARYATWDGEPWVPGGDYVVSVHRRVRGWGGEGHEEPGS